MLTSLTNRVSVLLFGALMGLALAWPGAAQASEPIYVQVDMAKVARLPANASTLVIGNPAIADVTMLKTTGAMVITGKSFGETNLIALDRGGEVVAESQIRVRQSGATMLVQRGVNRESYSCSPKCMPSPQIGDASKIFDAISQQVQARNSQAMSGSAATGAPGAR